MEIKKKIREIDQILKLTKPEPFSKIHPMVQNTYIILSPTRNGFWLGYSTAAERMIDRTRDSWCRPTRAIALVGLRHHSVTCPVNQWFCRRAITKPKSVLVGSV